MKKKLAYSLNAILAIGLAAPALAETTFSGTLVVQPMLYSSKDSLTKKFLSDESAKKPIDQRLRFTMTNKANDFVSVVWTGEIDTPWGSKSQASGKYTSKAGTGGALGTDGVNLETKHLYAVIKVPDTTFSAKLGLQSFKDSALGGLYLSYDVAGALFTFNREALTVNFGLGKPYSSDELYFALTGYKVSDAVNLNLDLFYSDVEEGGSDNDYATVGLGAVAKVADIDVDGGLGFQSGDAASGLLLNIGAKKKINDVSAGARVVYVADNDEGEQWKFISETPLYGEGLNIFGYSGTTGSPGNVISGAYAITDAAAKGAGLLGLIVNASVPVDAYTVKGAIGYFQATDEDVVGADGATLGTELGFDVSRKVAEKVNVALFGSYALLGDYYEGTAPGGEDPDDPYVLGLRVTAPF